MKRFLCISLIVLTITFVICFSVKTDFDSIVLAAPERTNSGPSALTQKTQGQQNLLPEHIPYAFLLLRYQNEMKTGNLRRFRTAIALDDDSFRKFEPLANDCINNLKSVDMQAKEIIEGLSRQFPTGKLPDGVLPPPPPPELEKLQVARNNSIISCKDRLKIDLGDGNFSNLENFVQREIKSKIAIRK